MQRPKKPVPSPANTPSGNWPTPTCADAFTDKLKSSQQQEGSMHSVNLSQAVRMWPTPTSQDGKQGGITPYQREGKWQKLLHQAVIEEEEQKQAVKMWPTPCASDDRDRGNMANPAIKRRVEMGKQVMLSMAVKEEVGGGQLNPDWVEWLMNWPIGWTSTEPLNPDRFLAWLQAFPSVPIASKPSVTDKCQQPQS